MSNKTLIEWNADVGTRFLTIHPDGSFDIDKDAPPLFVIGELAKAFIRQQDRIKRLEEWKESALAVEREWNANALATMLGGQPGESQREVIQREVPKLLKRIKRLLEAGSAMEWWCCNNEAVFLWRKAKEAKP